jgi:hypothetical protein
VIYPQSTPVATRARTEAHVTSVVVVAGTLIYLSEPQLETALHELFCPTSGLKVAPAMQERQSRSVEIVGGALSSCRVTTTFEAMTAKIAGK